MNKLIITNVYNPDSNTIKIDYKIEGDVINCITPSLEWFLKFNEDITDVPSSIAVVPFICNALPFIWLLDGVIEVPELDLDFYNSIYYIKKAYIDFYQNFKFRGYKNGVNPIKLVKNDYIPSDRKLCLFSGGVDSTSSIVSHINENLIIVPIWGADIYFNDETGWNNLLNYCDSINKRFNIKVSSVKSCFKRNLKYTYLNELVKNCHDNYWHAFQHGIGLSSHFAPLIYKYKVSTAYIPASGCVKDSSWSPCASVPTIDQSLKICGCSIIHDGYELNRQERLVNILNYSDISNYNFNIRSCFMSKGGGNCCICEKCLRTILGILVEGYDPCNFGFYNFDINKMENKIKELKLPLILKLEWNDIFNRYIYLRKHNKVSMFLSSKLDWILSYSF